MKATTYSLAVLLLIAPFVSHAGGRRSAAAKERSAARAAKVREMIQQDLADLQALLEEAKEDGDTVGAAAAARAIELLKGMPDQVDASFAAAETEASKPKEVNVQAAEMQKLKTDYLNDRSQQDSARVARLKELIARNLSDAETMLAQRKRSGNISGIAVGTKAVDIFKACSEQLDKQKDFELPAEIRRELKETMEVVRLKKKEIEGDASAALEQLEERCYDSFAQFARAQGVDDVSDEKLKKAFVQLVGVIQPRPRVTDAATGTGLEAAEGGKTPAAGAAAEALGPPAELGKSGEATDWVSFGKWHAEISGITIVGIPVANRSQGGEKEEKDLLSGGSHKTQYEPLRVLPRGDGCVFRVLSIPGQEGGEVLQWPTAQNRWTLQVRLRPGANIPSTHGLELQVSSPFARDMPVVADGGAVVASDGAVLQAGVLVEIRSEPDGAFVYVDGVLHRMGEAFAKTPCDIKVRPGQHDLLLRKPGFLDGTFAKFEVKEGAKIAWKFAKDPDVVDRTVRVDAGRSWYSSGVSVKPGDLVVIEASGTWSCGPGKEQVGPEGYPNDEKFFKYYMDPKSNPRQSRDANYGALLMRIGKVGQVRVVGKQLKTRADADGFLTFDINEADDGKVRRDNGGALSVHISKFPSKRQQ